MAVQAQYPSSNFGNRIQNNIMMMDDLQMLYGSNNNDVVFSNQESELTCIGSKKRMREECSVMMNQTAPPPIAGYSYQNSVVDQARLVESAGTSTSGRPVAQDLVARLYEQSLEVDALIRVHNERLRIGLEQAQKRHCRALISAFEQQVLKKLQEKEIELELLILKNAHLEEKFQQISAENHIWFSIAKNNETIVSSLKANLEQVLLQNVVNDNNAGVKEGYGDNDGTEDDAQSKNNGDVVTAVKDQRRTCRVCCDRDVSVLVLPCRHLCLCKDCESKADTCPVCHVSKNACLQIFMG